MTPTQIAAVAYPTLMSRPCGCPPGAAVAIRFGPISSPTTLQVDPNRPKVPLFVAAREAENAVARAWGVSPAILHKKGTRKDCIIQPRWVAIEMLSRQGFWISDIARYFGLHRCAAYYVLNRISELAEFYRPFRAKRELAYRIWEGK